ncbi:hypothetical protein D3C78_19710 [compost metagenome]
MSGYESIDQALALWVDITGVDPNQRRWVSVGDLQISTVNNDLKEALELDPSKSVLAIMLDYYLNVFLSNKTFSALKIIQDHDNFFAFMQKCKELRDLITHEEIKESQLGFSQTIQKSMSHYNVSSKEAFDMAKDIHTIGFLYRDALRAMSKLHTYQFSQGQPGTTDPIYYDTVHEYNNINSLLRDVAKMEKDGILVCLIRDELDTSSYFVFALRNGGTITILTDQEKGSHPLEKYKVRRPDKEFASRMFRYHFPYQSVLQTKVSADHRQAFLDKSSTELVIYQNAAIPRIQIADIEPNEVIWITMMFSLIEKKFWKENYKVPELAYTSEMIRVNNSLSSHLPALTENYKTLEVAPLTVEEVLFDNVKDQWDTPPTGQHKWLEDRYAHLVDQSLLNLMNAHGGTQKLMLTNSSDAPVTTTSKESVFRDLDIWSRRDLEDKLMTIHEMESTRFGTTKEVLDDYKWFGRYNFAQQINALVHKEFEERCNEIIDWYQKSIEKNKDMLLSHIAKGEWITIREKSPMGFVLNGIEKVTENQLIEFGHADWVDYHSRKDFFLHGGRIGHTSRYKCFINDTKANVYYKFRVDSKESLQYLAGCELPDVLQHWSPIERYSGNSNIRRIDPMEWVVKNPWNELSFDVWVYLGKNAVNQLRKIHNCDGH